MDIRDSYFNEGVDIKRRKHAVWVLCNVLAHVNFDTIVCRGVSGLVVAPIVSHLLNKNLTVIRKARENSHSSSIYEGYRKIARYVIIDDFVSTGDTVNEIIETVKNKISIEAECVGVFTYSLGSSEHESVPIYSCGDKSFNDTSRGSWIPPRHWGSNEIIITTKTWDRMMKNFRHGKVPPTATLSQLPELAEKDLIENP